MKKKTGKLIQAVALVCALLMTAASCGGIAVPEQTSASPVPNTESYFTVDDGTSAADLAGVTTEPEDRTSGGGEPTSSPDGETTGLPSGETEPDPGTSAEATSAGETTLPETTAEETTAEETTAEETTAEETTAEETTAEETTAEETTAEVTTAEETTAAHVHAFGAWTTVKAASCETAGQQKRVCACGVAETKAIPATGHVKVTDWNTPATCTASGLTAGSHCSVCGKVLEAQTAVPALGHTFGTNNKCVRCGITDPDLGTLLYYENFDSYATSSSSSTVLSRLGWKADSPANGAYKANTTAYSIVSDGSGKRLYLKNNTSNGADSYVVVIPASLMG